MDVLTVNDLAHAAQALLLFVFSFVLVGLITGAAVDSIGPKSITDGDVAKGFYRRKYAAVAGLVALGVFAIGTVVYASPKPLDAAAIIAAAVSFFFAICLIFEKLPFHSKRVAAPDETAGEGSRALTPPTIGLMNSEPPPVPPAPPVPAPPVIEPEVDPGLDRPADSDLVPESEDVDVDDPEAGPGLAGSAFGSDSDESRSTVPVGLADVEPTQPDDADEVVDAGAAEDDVPSDKKSRKGKKKKKKK